MEKPMLSNQWNRKRKHPKKHKRHDKQHQSAASRPDVRKRIAALRQDWPSINAVERGRRVLRLLDEDCTIRGLGRDLARSPRAIEMAIDVAGLPEQYQSWIEQGASPKRVLTQAKSKNNMSRTQLRLQQEQKDG